jgi:hypothetical protein
MLLCRGFDAFFSSNFYGCISEKRNPTSGFPIPLYGKTGGDFRYNRVTTDSISPRSMRPFISTDDLAIEKVHEKFPWAFVARFSVGDLSPSLWPDARCSLDPDRTQVGFVG